jgi:hypothetical protein
VKVTLRAPTEPPDSLNAVTVGVMSASTTSPLAPNARPPPSPNPCAYAKECEVAVKLTSWPVAVTFAASPR